MLGISTWFLWRGNYFQAADILVTMDRAVEEGHKHHSQPINNPIRLFQSYKKYQELLGTFIVQYSAVPLSTVPGPTPTPWHGVHKEYLSSYFIATKVTQIKTLKGSSAIPSSQKPFYKLIIIYLFHKKYIFQRNPSYYLIPNSHYPM